MEVYKCAVLVCLISCAFGESDISKEKLLQACKMGDLDCVRMSTQKYLEHTSNGIPKYDIKAIDPLHIAALDYDVHFDTGVKHHLKNVTVTGIKNLELSDLKMADKAQLTMKVDISANSDITLEFTKEKKTFDGEYTITGKGKAVATYPYTVVKKEDTEYFEVGEATYEYEIDEVPHVKFSDTLRKELENDIQITDSRNSVLENREQLSKDCLKKVLEKAIPIVIHNLKRASELLPKDAFFTD